MLHLLHCSHCKRMSSCLGPVFHFLKLAITPTSVVCLATGGNSRSQTLETVIKKFSV